MSRAQRAAANRAAPRFITSITAGTTAVASSVSAYIGSFLYFSARTATVYVNFGPTSSLSAATTAAFPIALGTAQEFEITVDRAWVSVVAGSTATMGIGTTTPGDV